MATSITVDNAAVNGAFEALGAKLSDFSPVLRALSDDMIERTKGRFASATAPDGAAWKPNTQATLIAYIQKQGGFSTKTGRILAKGQKLAMGKKPLQGESGDLARQFSSIVAGGNQLLVGSTMVYAAMQQFGGTKAQFKNLWGDIPARPFLPIQADGTIYPAEESAIVDMLQAFLNA